MLRPSCLPVLDADEDTSDFLSDVDEKDHPKIYVALDGKPSDRYVRGGHYCLATLIANSLRSVSSVGYRIQDKLQSSNIKFKKLSQVRGKKRKNKYIQLVLDVLIEISKEQQGLPFNYRIALSSAEALNPNNILSDKGYTDHILNNLGGVISEKHVSFNLNGKPLSIGINEFGAIIWWHHNLLKIADENGLSNTEASWWIHMDRLPLDHDCTKTTFLASYLDHFFQQKLWFSFTEDGDLPEDILPDFFANIFYDITYKNILVEPLIKTKVRTLNELNIR